MERLTNVGTNGKIWKTQSEFVSEYIGDVVFLTKPDAETRLKEIEKKQIG